jgi:hypothetical protein
MNVEGGAQRRNWAGILAVALVASGIVTYRRTTARQATPTVSVADGARVVMVYETGQVDDWCGCGDVIHAVRAAAKDGLRVREVERDSPEAASYSYTFTPAILILDDEGHVVRQHEGGSKETLRDVTADLATTKTALRAR